MTGSEERVARLLRRIDSAWASLQESYAGLPEARLTEPGVIEGWSVNDILAHVTTWEQEALTHLPTIVAGGRPPRYVTYGGIDAFNARMTEQKRGLSLDAILTQMDETHHRLVELVWSAPVEQLAPETRFRRRLRLDTYGHYPLHAAAIREWREGRSDG
jgi:hypothetical protein